MFTKAERSTFSYWFAHWCSFNLTALNLKCWRPKFLLHDIEKPWLKLITNDYSLVQKWHREHNDHHVTYWIINGKADFLAMVIDWECSRFTKAEAQLNARETLTVEVEELAKTDKEKSVELAKNIEPILDKLGL